MPFLTPHRNVNSVELPFSHFILYGTRAQMYAPAIGGMRAVVLFARRSDTVRTSGRIEFT
jgi:hypothetical protein